MYFVFTCQLSILPFLDTETPLRWFAFTLCHHQGVLLREETGTASHTPYRTLKLKQAHAKTDLHAKSTPKHSHTPAEQPVFLYPAAYWHTSGLCMT